MQRHEIVAKSAEKRRDHNEEHHQDAVARDQDVPEVAVWRTGRGAVREEPRAFEAHVLNAGVYQLHPHVDGEGDGDEADEPGREQVQNTDVFVVGGHEPAGKEPRSSCPSCPWMAASAMSAS